MSRLLVFVCLLLAPTLAAAELTIDTPLAGEAVSTPFLVEGHADPGELLELVIDDRVLLVFRATSDGTFSIPVDVQTSGFVIRSLKDPTFVASVAVSMRSGGTDRTTRTETAAVQAGEDAVAESPAQTPSLDVPKDTLAVAAPTEDSAATASTVAPPRDAKELGPDATAEVMELGERPVSTADDVVPQIVPQIVPEPIVATQPSSPEPEPPSDLATANDVVPSIVPSLGSDENQLQLQTENPRTKRPWKRWHVPTLLTQVPAGLAGGLAGAYGGLVTGFYVVEPVFGYPASVATVAVPTTLFFTAATGFAVWGVGKLWGGKSPWWASMIGAAVGTAGSFAFPPLFVGLPSVSATVAYHLAARP